MSKKMHLFFKFLSACAFSLSFIANAQEVETERVALIIANSNYDSVPRLTNPPRDAELIAISLTEAGFTVTHHENLRRQEFAQALREFGAEARKANVALIYYAGHGVEIDRENFLIPVDAQMKSAASAHIEAISLEDTFRFVSDADQLRIVVLDACRDNPFLADMRADSRYMTRRGLASVSNLPSGTIVAYSAAPGQLAHDGPNGGVSPYAASFASRISEPGLEINFVFRHIRNDVLNFTENQQRPWFELELGPDRIVFVPDQNSSYFAMEKAAFEKAMIEWDLTVWASFIKNFPSGRLTESARAAIDQLQSNPHHLARSQILESANLALENISSQEWSAGEASHIVAKVISYSSIDALNELATYGNPKAQLVLGMMHTAGLAGAPQNYERAGALIRSAASSGFPRALVSLGYLHNRGVGGIEKNTVEAARLYRIAADQGNAMAAASLGHMYHNGLGGLEQDDVVAANLFTRAAGMQNALALANLGYFYQHGLGGIPQDTAEAIRLFQRSAELGSPLGQVNLGALYFNGDLGVDRDRVEAVKWYEISANLGNSTAQGYLGFAYEFGLGGLDIDIDRALQLYRQATEQGDLYAIRQLERLRSTQ